MTKRKLVNECALTDQEFLLFGKIRVLEASLAIPLKPTLEGKKLALNARTT